MDIVPSVAATKHECDLIISGIVLMHGFFHPLFDTQSSKLFWGTLLRLVLA